MRTEALPCTRAGIYVIEVQSVSGGFVPKGVVIVAGARFSVSRRMASRRVPPQSVNEEARREVARVGELAEKYHDCSKFM